MTERDDIAAWLRLTLTPGVGNETARKLLQAFGLPSSIFQQTYAALGQVVSEAQTRALLAEPADLASQLEVTLEWLDGGSHERGFRHLLNLADPGYPQRLLDTADPPLMLYILGNAPYAESAFESSFRRSIAIVGSRNPTPQGAANARQFAQALAAESLVVVSGLALGVDGAAHEGALDGAPSSQDIATIAVVGTGLDRVYPKSHFDLAHRIAKRGLVISEFAIGTPPMAPNFPKRNRIISGLAQGTLVVEAAVKSGSLITAKMAAEQGKEVFAIPGSIHAPQSRGCHWLIRQGAKLVESAQDVLEDLRLPFAHSVQTEYQQAASTRELESMHPILKDMGFDPISLDELLARTGMTTAALQAALLELELEGHVARLPGGQFQRVARA